MCMSVLCGIGQIAAALDIWELARKPLEGADYANELAANAAIENARL